jgi:hypothetical protein
MVDTRYVAFERFSDRATPSDRIIISRWRWLKYFWRPKVRAMCCVRLIVFKLCYVAYKVCMYVHDQMEHTHYMHESFFFSRLASTKLCRFNARMSSKRAKEHTRLSETQWKRSK